jgi:hypothetical protein
VSVFCFSLRSRFCYARWGQRYWSRRSDPGIKHGLRLGATSLVRAYQGCYRCLVFETPTSSESRRAWPRLSKHSRLQHQADSASGFHGPTLRSRSEQERSSSRSGDCQKFYKGQLTGLRPSPTSHGVVGFRLRAGSRRDPRSERPTATLARPRCVDHNAKCVCAGQMCCRRATERASSTLRPPDPTREHQT